MKDKHKDKDRWYSKIRSPYERVFANRNKEVRYVGIAKNQFAAFIDIQSEWIEVNDNDLKHLFPASMAHINRYGKYIFNKEKAFKDKLRPLRNKKK